MKHSMRVILLLFCCCCLSRMAWAECERIYKTTALSENIEDDISIPYLRSIMDKAGCRLEIVPVALSHHRRLRLIESGELDVVGEASILPERNAYAWFSRAYRIEKTVLIGLRNNTTIASVHHINDVADQGIHILSPAGGWFGADLERERQRWQQLKLIISFKDPLVGLRDLRLGRGQLLVTTDALVKTMFARDSDVYVLPFTVHQEPVYFMFSKRTVSEKEVHFFNQLIHKIKP